MRYFTYISDAKVDMLLPQVPHRFKEDVAAEIGFNVGILSAKVGSKVPILESRVSRAQVVERHIRNHETIGTPGAPRAWHEGTFLAYAGATKDAHNDCFSSVY